MHFKDYDVFYLPYSHQHVSANIAAIFEVNLLLQAYKNTSGIRRVAVNPQQLKNIIISVQII